MILALDISLYTGWAYGAGGNIAFGSRSFTAYAGNDIRVGRHFRGWVDAMLDEKKPEWLVLERPFFRGDCTWLLVGMAWEAQRSAEERGIKCKDYAVQSIKKHMTGDGRAKKPDMMRAVRRLGFAVTNDHEADAIAILRLHETGQRPAPVDDQMSMF